MTDEEIKILYQLNLSRITALETKINNLERWNNTNVYEVIRNITMILILIFIILTLMGVI